MDWQAECARLRRENAALWQENRRLRQQLGLVEDEKDITKTEKTAKPVKTAAPPQPGSRETAATKATAPAPAAPQPEPEMPQQLCFTAPAPAAPPENAQVATPDTPAPLSPAVHARSSTAEKIALFRRLFRGRADVYARRWYSEKQQRGGYAPVCRNEWEPALCDKRRYKCAACPNRSLAPLTDQALYAHLAGRDPLGRDVVGLYPLLPDETCHLLAFDFDDAGAQAEANALRAVCAAQGLPCLVERSRSGTGAHLWLFFAGATPAKLARELGSALLTAAMEQNRLLDFSAYDRMFPNQDTMPKGGFGSLIALPLQGAARRNGNTVFLDETGAPYPDPWAILSAVHPLTAAQIQAALAALAPVAAEPLPGDSAPQTDAPPPDSTPVPDHSAAQKPWRKPTPAAPLTAADFGGAPLPLTLADGLYLPLEPLSGRALHRLRRLAAFSNPEFYRAQAMRLSVHGKPRVICCAETVEGHLRLPRGCAGAVTALLTQAGAAYTVADERCTGQPVAVRFNGTLRPEQQPAAEALLAHDTGVLCATTAFGKTVVASWLVAARRTNTLILVHTQALLNQWKTALEQFLIFEEPPPPTAPPRRGRKKQRGSIGQLGGGKNTLNGVVDIAILQSLTGEDAAQRLANYGMVLVDECHHVSAVRFEQVLRAVRARYVYGLTATPKRQDGHQPIIQMQCGPIRYVVDAKAQAAQQPFDRVLLPRFTHFALPLSKDEPWHITRVFELLTQDEARNAQIAADVCAAVQTGRTPLVLTERYDHAQALAALLKQRGLPVYLMTGHGTAKEKRDRLSLLQMLPDAAPAVVVATGKYAGEGFDFPRLDTLFLAIPVAWSGTLAQYAGRLHRSAPGKTQVQIYDYVDVRVPVLERMYHKRMAAYRTLAYAVQGPHPAPKAPLPVLYEYGGSRPGTPDFTTAAATTSSPNCSQSDYETAFLQQLQNAQKEVVLSAAALHTGRVVRLLRALQVPAAHGVRCAVVLPQRVAAKAKTGSLTANCGRLQAAGIKLILTEQELPRFAVLDAATVWYGSLDLLGYPRPGDTTLCLQDPQVARELLDCVPRG